MIFWYCKFLNGNFIWDGMHVMGNIPVDNLENWVFGLYFSTCQIYFRDVEVLISFFAPRCCSFCQLSLFQLE